MTQNTMNWPSAPIVYANHQLGYDAQQIFNQDQLATIRQIGVYDQHYINSITRAEHLEIFNKMLGIDPSSEIYCEDY